MSKYYRDVNGNLQVNPGYQSHIFQSIVGDFIFAIILRYLFVKYTRFILNLLAIVVLLCLAGMDFGPKDLGTYVDPTFPLIIAGFLLVCANFMVPVFKRGPQII